MNRQQLLQALNQVMAPLSRRLQALVSRSVSLRTVYKDNVQMIQVRLPDGSASDFLESMHPFGYASYAPDGAEPIVIALSGQGAHRFILLVNDRRYQLRIDKGEMAIHNEFFDKVHIKNNREIDIQAAVKVNLKTPLTHVENTLSVGGDFQVAGHSTLTGGAKINDVEFIDHDHNYTDNGSTLVTDAVNPA